MVNLDGKVKSTVLIEMKHLMIIFCEIDRKKREKVCVCLFFEREEKVFYISSASITLDFFFFDENAETIFNQQIKKIDVFQDGEFFLCNATSADEKNHKKIKKVLIFKLLVSLTKRCVM